MASIVMPFAPTGDAVAQAIACARAGRPAWVAVHGPVSAGPLFGLSEPADSGPGAAWQGPDGVAWRGVGAARVWEAHDAAEATGLAEACRQALKDCVFGTPGALEMARGFGALAFDLQGPAPRARFVLPAWLLRQGDAGTEGLVLAPVWPNDRPGEAIARAEAAWRHMAAWAAGPAMPTGWPRMTAVPAPEARAAWEAMVGQALEAIAEREVAKVVLARAIPLEAPAPVPAGAVFAALAEAAPGTYRFLLRDGDGAFLGASPELLFRTSGGRLWADCLAGTAPRGADEAADTALGRGLLASGKDRREHAFVAEAIAAALYPFAAKLTMPLAPTLRRLPTVQHLHTPVEVELREEASLGALLAAMHPTPAVGGTPRAAAIDWIRRLEGTPRGWYAGPVGWVSREAAEFAVAIRSASLQGHRAAVWAGAGIVAGSVPALEWEETARKALPLMRLLTREEASR